MFCSHFSLSKTTWPPCLASVQLLAPLLAEGHAASSVQEAVVNMQEIGRDDDVSEGEIDENKRIQMCLGCWTSNKHSMLCIKAHIKPIEELWRDSGHLHCHSHTDNSGAAIFGSYLEFRTDYAILTSVKIGQFCNSLIPTISQETKLQKS